MNEGYKNKDLILLPEINLNRNPTVKIFFILFSFLFSIHFYMLSKISHYISPSSSSKKFTNLQNDKTNAHAPLAEEASPAFVGNELKEIIFTLNSY